MPASRGRWQDDGLAISFRACRLTSLDTLGDALAQSESGVAEEAVAHLDLAENELPSLDGVPNSFASAAMACLATPTGSRSTACGQS